MKIKVIKSEKDYKEAVQLLEEIGDDPDFEKLIDEFELLETLIGLYEKEHYSIAPVIAPVYEKLIVAIDADGTIFEHTFPEMGKPIPYAIEAIKAIKAAGHKIILWTCREDLPHRKVLTEAVEYCRQNGIEFDAINDNIKPYEDHLYTNCRKVYANLYIDDKNRLDRKVDWLEILRELNIRNDL